MHSRPLFSIVGALALMAALPSGKVSSAPPPAVQTYREVEVASFSTPTLARPGASQELSASVASFDRMTLRTSDFERVAPVESLDLFMADEPLRRQVVKPDPVGSVYTDSMAPFSVPSADRWRVNLGDHDRIPLRI